MHIEFTATRDRSYARRLFRERTRTSRMGYLKVALALPATGALFVATGGVEALDVLCVELGLAGVFVLTAFRCVRRMLDRHPPEWFEPRSYIVTDSGIDWRGDHYRGGISWDVVGMAKETPFAVLLWQKGGALDVWDLPLAAMTEEQREELRLFLRNREIEVAARGYKPATEAGTGRLRPPAPDGAERMGR